MTDTNINLWLKYVSAEGIVVARSRLDGDWGVQMERGEGTYFHFLAKGRACYCVEGGPAAWLEPGDLIILPQGAPHQLKSSEASKTTSLLNFIKDITRIQSTSPEATVIMCGQFGLDRHMVLPAIKALPVVLHLKADASENSPIPEVLKQLRNELDTSKIGNKIIIRHLLSTLFIYVLREWSENSPTESDNWFSAMQNTRIAKALACIHRSPENGWNLTTLSQEAGLSRAAFARQFRDSVGETPHSYLTRWRLGVAAQLLTQTKLSISEIAQKVGYKSEDSFNRAFKLIRGMTPTKAREQLLLERPISPPNA